MAATGTIRWIAYFLGAGLLVLLIAFGAQNWLKRDSPLPVVTELPGMDGLSCTDGLARARELSRTSPDQSRLSYFWLMTHCADSPVLQEAMLEVGALLAYHLQQPTEAQQVYQLFLHRFPSDPAAADVLLQLAKLELDKGDYSSAVSHLTELVQRYPDSSHQDSARFLAERAAEMLAVDRQAVRTPLGRFRQMVPNNAASVLMLVMGFIPAVYTAISTAQNFKTAKGKGAKAMLALVIICTLGSFAVNDFKKAQETARLDTEISALK